MRKFASRISHKLILKSKYSLLIKVMYISRVVDKQQVEDEKRKQSEFSEKQWKKFRPFEQRGRDGGKWLKNKWASFGSIYN